MRFFLDTEFIEAGPTKPIRLISIGLVSEDGREYYAQSSEYNPDDASAWVKENVIPRLLPEVKAKPLKVIAMEVVEFIWRSWPERGESPEFWGYFADYDWVVFCQMFGTMMNLPSGFPMYCRDIKQLCDSLQSPALPPEPLMEHNALHDARWNKRAYADLIARQALEDDYQRRSDYEWGVKSGRRFPVVE